jgi:hypothetical protein
MDPINVELCPETGICSLYRKNGAKTDLMPDEVEALRQAAGDAGALRRALAEVDETFAKSLSSEELASLAQRI